MRFPILAARALGIVALAAVTMLAACNDDSTGPDRSVVFTQIDRFGLPAINTVFIESSNKQTYNMSVPANDRAQFKPRVVAVLQAFGNSAATADALANALLPDMQPINTTQPTAFLNGRALADDVIDAELGLIFGGNAALNSDNVDANDRPFSGTFPYLAGPNL